MQITTIGLDIAKNVFQVHGIDAAEKVVVRRQLRRSQVLKFFASLPPFPGAWTSTRWHTAARQHCA
jgi:transposase